MSLNAAVIEPVGGHSGMDYYDYGLCNGLQQAHVDVTLYTCDEPGILATTPFKVKPYYVRIYGSDPAWRRALRYLKGSWQSLHHARQQKAHISHLHFFHIGPLELINVLLSKAMGLRVIVTAHDVKSFADGLSVTLFEHWSYQLADRIIVHNQVSQHELLASLPVKPEKLAVIPHGNYLNMINAKPIPNSTAARDKFGIPIDAKVLLFFGQIKDVKGLDLLLQAMPAIVASYPKTRLIVAGRAWKADFQKYQHIIDQHQLADYCHLFIEHVPHDMVSTYFAAADLVVLPYKRIYQSGVLLMSMSFGKPVLTSDLPGMVEIINDGNTGYLFGTENAAALTKKVLHVFNNASEAQQVAANGLALVTEVYGWSRIGQQTAQLYATTLEVKNPGS